MSPTNKVSPSSHVTLTLSKFGNGYQVGVDPWEVKVHRFNDPRAIDWELNLGSGLVMQKFEVGFKGNDQYFDPVTSTPAASGNHTAKTTKIKDKCKHCESNTVGRKGTFGYDVTFHFKDGPNEVKILLDPDYIVED